MNLLEVTGLVRLDPDDEDTGNDGNDDERANEDENEGARACKHTKDEKATFDVWPSANALTDIYHKECVEYEAADDNDKGWEGAATARWEEACGWNAFENDCYEKVQEAKMKATYDARLGPERL